MGRKDKKKEGRRSAILIADNIYTLVSQMYIHE